jgi:quercetin dioxygenase-like cupin family protein
MNHNALKGAVHVSGGKDRFKEDELMIWGLLPLSIKLSAKDSGGELLVFEHNGIRKGGPPRHVHYAQDEWFYVIKGEFAFEVGDEKFRLGAGDTLFAPRNVPHGWAHVSDQPGTLLTTVSPAGTFETFILETTRHPNLPPPEEVEKAFAAHGMKVVGPPLEVTNL